MLNFNNNIKMSREEKIYRICLDFGFHSELIEAFTQLCLTKKWLKKPISAIEKNAKSLLRFDYRFAVQLCRVSFNNDYQGLVFVSTESEYQKWLKQNRNADTKVRELESKLAKRGIIQ